MPAIQHALITGGAGFIGSHLADHLLMSGWRVTALDDLSTGKVENVAHLEGTDTFRLVVGSAADRSLITELAPEVTTVFHLAAVVGVRRVIDDSVGTIERNLHCTEEVLRACNKYRLRLLITSTSEVYGSGSRERFRESDDAIIGNSRHRRWSYAASKLLDEFYAFAYHYSSALQVTVVRLFNTIGPKQVGHYGMVVPTFIRQALRGEPITVYGDGSQRRCFTHVKDVVRCLKGLIDDDKTAGQIFNIGSDNEISILALAEKIREMTGSSSKVVFKSYEEGYGEDFRDMERRVPDTTMLKDALGYVPDTPLEEILQDTIASIS